MFNVIPGVYSSMTRFISVFVVVVLCVSCSGSGGTPDVQTVFEVSAAKYGVPGAVLAVADNTGSTAQYAYGKSNVLDNTEMNTDAAFHVGSITKSFTATAILMLVDRGQLSLDATVDSILPGTLAGGNVTTVRNLLTMRSGLSDYTSNSSFSSIIESDPHHKWTYAELAPMVVADDEPDDCFAYRNINYVTLGAILEAVSNQTRAEFVAKEICEPLGLANTYVPTDWTMPVGAARGYLPIDNATTDMTEYVDPSWGGAAGDMVSTAGDILKWLDDLEKGTLLSNATKAEMFTLYGASLRGLICGYGCGVLNLSGAIGHGGNYSDIYTAAMFSWQGRRIVILVNGKTVDSTGDATDVFFDFVHSMYPASDNQQWRNEQLDTLLDLTRKQLDIPGAVAQVNFADGRGWNGTTGLAATDNSTVEHARDWSGTPMTRDLKFRIASVTKSMTATAMLMLVDNGTITLDDTLGKWLPNSTVSTKDSVTVRQLLSHTSGIPDFIRNSTWFNLNYADPLQDWTLAERISYGAPVTTPPADYSYSNTGYILLAQIAEAATGQAFGDFLTVNIFTPLGMTNSTTPGLTEYTMPDPYARGYTLNFNLLDGEVPDTMPAGGWLKDQSTSNWQGIGYGDVIATPDDLAIWLQALTNGTLLSAESRAAMHAYGSTGTDGVTYGLGVENNGGYIGHDGDLPGYHTGAYAKGGNRFIVIMNGDSLRGHGHDVVKSMGAILGE